MVDELGRLVVQVIENDIALLAREVHAGDDDVLAFGRVVDERNLVRARADDFSEHLFRFSLHLAGKARTAPLGPADAPFVVSINHALGVDAERVVVGSADPERVLDPWEVAANRIPVDLAVFDPWPGLGDDGSGERGGGS